MPKKTTEFDPTNLPGEAEQVLAVLANTQSQGSQWLTAPEVAARLRDDHGIGLHWRRVSSLLQANRALVNRRKRNRQWQYMLLRAGREHLATGGSPIAFVDPSKALQATLSLHSFLNSLVGTARICDPYLDPSTLDHLSACNTSLAIRLLTKNIRDPGRVRALLSAARTEGRNIEVRVAAAAPLHDRYIIDDRRMLILGTSLNGFGRKQGFVVQAGGDVRSVVGQAFDSSWSGAALWP